MKLRVGKNVYCAASFQSAIGAVAALDDVRTVEITAYRSIDRRNMESIMWSCCIQFDFTESTSEDQPSPFRALCEACRDEVMLQGDVEVII